MDIYTKLTADYNAHAAKEGHPQITESIMRKELTHGRLFITTLLSSKAEMDAAANKETLAAATMPRSPDAAVNLVYALLSVEMALSKVIRRQTMRYVDIPWTPADLVKIEGCLNSFLYARLRELPAISLLVEELATKLRNKEA